MARIGLAAFILVMCALDVAWIRQNTAPPRMFDDSAFLIESVDLFRTLQEEGVGAFLTGTTIYSRRGHPPMMKTLPTFTYLFLGLGTNAALYAYTVLIAVFCVYLFLLARQLLDSDAKALLAVVITCLFPIIYGMWRQVMTEFGVTVAVTGCLYHVLRSQGFRHSGHSLAVGAFVGWGLLWKITFPIFVVGAIALVLRSQREWPIRGLILALFAALVVAGPFYARSWFPVLAFAIYQGNPDYQRVWGLGPVYSPLTVARYWLLVVNWAITPYFFALMVLASGVRRWRGQTSRVTRDTPFLLAAFVPAFLLMTFHPLKEVRHLMPALPLLGIAAARLVVDLVAPFRRVAPLALAALLLWPAYQFASWSFDSPLVPRAELRWGPIMLSTRDLEAQSTKWMPTFTFPANSTYWPTRKTVETMATRLSSSGERARVHVAGTNPYFNGLTLRYEATLARLPFAFDFPFTDDYIGADFVVISLASRRYGALDERPTPAESAMNRGDFPFTLVATLPLEDGGEVRVYEANRRVHPTAAGG